MFPLDRLNSCSNGGVRSLVASSVLCGRKNIYRRTNWHTGQVIRETILVSWSREKRPHLYVLCSTSQPLWGCDPLYSSGVRRHSKGRRRRAPEETCQRDGRAAPQELHRQGVRVVIGVLESLEPIVRPSSEYPRGRVGQVLCGWSGGMTSATRCKGH